MERGEGARGVAARPHTTDQTPGPSAAEAPATPRALRTYRHMIALLVAVSLGFCAAATWVVWQDYRNARAEAERESTNVVDLVAGRVSLAFSAVRIMLRSVQGVLRATETLENPPHAALLGVVANEAVAFPHIAALVIVDRSGKIVFQSGQLPHDPARISEQEYFLAQRDAEVPVPYIGFIAAGTDNTVWYGTVSIRVFTAGERASGVAIAIIDPEYFQRTLDAIRLGPGGGIAIFDRTGRLLVRSAGRTEFTPGQFVAGPRFHEELAARPKGSYFAPTRPDGKLRLVSFELLAVHSLAVVVAQSPDDFLGPVYRRLAFQVVLLALLIGAIAVASYYTARELRRRLAAQAQLEASESRMRRISANVPGILFTRVLGHDGKLRYPFRSPRMFELYGVDPDTGREDGDAMMAFIHPDDRAGFLASIMASAREMTPWQYEARVRPSAGVERWVLSQAIPYRQEDGTVAWDGISVDITAERNAREALRAALDKAETASRAKTAFLGHMSHELRTPLNAVIGFSEMMAAGVGGALAPKQKEYVDDIGASARHLLNIIEGLLEIARIERGETALLDQVVEARALCDAVLTMCEGAAARAGVKLVDAFELGGARLRVDPQAIRQILVNLVINAVQHTPSGGTVTLAARLEGGPVFAVIDTGKGMEPDQLAELNRPLEASDAIRRPSAVGGLGIGLHIGRQLSELHGGRLDIASVPGQGTTVIVTLPAQRLLGPGDVAASPAAQPA